jgi:hypothetical protein
MDVVFTIGHAGKLKTENFNTFAAFVSQLTTELAATSTTTMTMTTAPTVDVIAAAGQYDSATNALTARRLAVLLSN